MARQASIVRSMSWTASMPAVAGDAGLAAARDGTEGNGTLVGTHRADRDNGGG